MEQVEELTRPRRGDDIGDGVGHLTFGVQRSARNDQFVAGFYRDLFSCFSIPDPGAAADDVAVNIDIVPVDANAWIGFGDESGGPEPGLF